MSFDKNNIFIGLTFENSKIYNCYIIIILYEDDYVFSYDLRNDKE